MLIAICNAHTAREISRAVESENKLNKQKKKYQYNSTIFQHCPQECKKGSNYAINKNTSERKYRLSLRFDRVKSCSEFIYLFA